MSSSRSTKVIEQLQETWETIQKDLANTKTQLASARQLKCQAEEDAKNNAESNRSYRTNIQELMQVLESKQQALDMTKKSSVDLESQVKKLKNEALASRKQLEDLRRKEQVLERDRDIAVAEKERTERQCQILTESMTVLGSRFEREMTGLRNDLTTVEHQVASIADHAQEQALSAESKIRKQTDKRKEHMRRLVEAKTLLETNTQAFVDHVQAEFQTLIDAIDKAAGRTDDFQTAVSRCRGEVNGLVSRIRTYTAASGVD
ncbi:hypothetical protein DFQ28_008408 [Apophysomyces sp. BC1034]|nr:hypothetical protein DFQ30_007942 [Apophysomyces sp. BC1015]KAG0181867.1 hypothetical protein DFQ29_006661 [Apophysomyces sp. BC1021]KAG0192659.1 hypothetical protein DFQ28_008408 [Apophysomyces sp. BC1034]